MNNPHNDRDPVKDTESLYRRIKNKGDAVEYGYDDDGNLEIYPDAFRDGKKKISLYRASKILCKPENARMNNIEGVVDIIADTIFSIPTVVTELEDQNIHHKVKIIYKPSNTPGSGIAHSLIIVEPWFTGNKLQQKMAFLKLKEALAIIATKNGWALPPPDSEIDKAKARKL